MDVLPFHFRALELCGMWCENKKYLVLKMIYGITAMFIILLVVLGQLIKLVTIQNNVDDFTESLFITFTMISFKIKLLNFVTRRKDMENLLNYFRTPNCQSKSLEEETIILKYSKNAKNIFLYFLCITHVSGVVQTLIPILISQSKFVNLPYKTYQPYSNSAISFWITYAMQLFTSFYAITLNVSLDTMTYGFIILAVGQIKINCHRLMNYTVSIKEFIEHQILIQQIVYNIESFFIRVVLPYFFLTLLVLCSSIFQISQKSLGSIEFFSVSSYIICILTEIFFYCWFGNELELHSQAMVGEIFASKWLSYSVKERKNLWLIMLYSKSGSKISFHGQCNLSLHTFLWIVKTSYGMFNLLKHITI